MANLPSGYVPLFAGAELVRRSGLVYTLPMPMPTPPVLLDEFTTTNAPWGRWPDVGPAWGKVAGNDTYLEGTVSGGSWAPSATPDTSSSAFSSNGLGLTGTTITVTADILTSAGALTTENTRILVGFMESPLYLVPEAPLTGVSLDLRFFSGGQVNGYLRGIQGASIAHVGAAGTWGLRLTSGSQTAQMLFNGAVVRTAQMSATFPVDTYYYGVIIAGDARTPGRVSRLEVKG